MDPEMVSEFENEVSKLTARIPDLARNIKENIKKMESIRESAGVEQEILSEYESIERDLDTIAFRIQSSIDDAQKEGRRIIRNLVADAHKKEVAEVNRIRLEAYRPPIAPKYIGTMGTALLGVAGATYTSTYILTEDVNAAFQPFLYIFLIGLLLISTCVFSLARYDAEIRGFHETLLLEPFEDMIIEGGNEPPK